METARSIGGAFPGCSVCTIGVSAKKMASYRCCGVRGGFGGGPVTDKVSALSQVSDVLGSQWGDEGKGKLVDVLAPRFDILARCQDHHCVWINNCVGYANYKSFIICVLNATIGSLYSLVVFLYDLFQTEHGYDVPCVKVIHVLVGVLLFFLSLTIGSLLCWHIYLLCHNMTTIEYREATRAKWLAQKSGQKYRHRFDLGTRKNIQMIMGPNILCWLCPTATGHLKDGTEFQITNN